MIRCIAWKRLEANRIFSIANVTKKEFNSIMRRAFVFRMMARFEDPVAVQGSPLPFAIVQIQFLSSADCSLAQPGAYPDIGKDGIFTKDQELRDFLTSGPAILAALQLQHAFECQHNQEDV